MNKAKIGSVMASSCVIFEIVAVLLGLTASGLSLGVGINYGQIANNLPSPSRVAILLKSANISRVKLYDADPNVLEAFSESEVEFIIGLGNEYLEKMSDDPLQAQEWIEQHVSPHLPRTKITCITVGNEIFSSNDTRLLSSLLPAMQSVQSALLRLGLDRQVTVTSAHSLAILENSYPPSSGTFRQDFAPYLQPLLSFHSQIKSPFLINAYPYFSYKDSPKQVPLDYLLFQPNRDLKGISASKMGIGGFYRPISANEYWADGLMGGKGFLSVDFCEKGNHMG